MAAQHKRLNREQSEEQEKKKRKLLQEMKNKPVTFRTVADHDFQQLLHDSYRGLVYYPAAQFVTEYNQELFRSCMTDSAVAASTSSPSSTSSEFDVHHVLKISCFLNLLHQGFFFRDVIQVGGNDAGGGTAAANVPAKFHYVRTRVQRCLVGEPGMTYRYSGVRLFAHPWLQQSTRAPEEELKAASSSSISSILHPASVIQPFSLLHALNTHMRRVTHDALNSTYQLPTDPPGARDPSGGDFNLTLINYLDPRTHRQPLKIEPYYKMGHLAVGWHRDESLEELSSIAVYHSSEETDVSKQESNADEYWHIALKRLWDIKTPAVKIALQSGDAYIMAYDLNTTHQHAVLAGTGKRFSSTHRRAKKVRDTLEYITNRSHSVIQTWSTIDSPSDVTLDGVQLLFDVSIELEFEWIRQFWIQGARHARNHTYYWLPHIQRLETEWSIMQTKLAWLYQQLANYQFSMNQPNAVVSQTPDHPQPSSTPSVAALDLPICRCFLTAFQTMTTLRQQWHTRYEQDVYYPNPQQRDQTYSIPTAASSDSSTTAAAVTNDHEDEPIIRPTFEASSALPYDLSSHLYHLAAWEEEFAQIATKNS